MFRNRKCELKLAALYIVNSKTYVAYLYSQYEFTDAVEYYKIPKRDELVAVANIIYLYVLSSFETNLFSFFHCAQLACAFSILLQIQQYFLNTICMICGIKLQPCVPKLRNLRQFHAIVIENCCDKRIAVLRFLFIDCNY